MNKVFLQKIKNMLLTQKQAILRQTGQEISIDTEGDETDEIQGNILIELNNQLSTRNFEKLALIEQALKRIVDKTYGMCQDCEETIPEKRLLANPHFLTCVSCAEDREIEAKQKRGY